MKSIYTSAYTLALQLPAVISAEATNPDAASLAATTTEEFSTTNRIGCVADFDGFHFNLKELSLPIDE